jgi:glycosyltransferase involved in cell wall biosynthesis
MRESLFEMHSLSGVSDMNWLVVPIYNEADRFDLNYWNSIVINSEISILFVDDGSRDNSLTILEGFLHPRVSAIKLESNSGKAEAIRQGFIHLMNGPAKESTFIGYLDADSAFDPLEVSRILTSSEEQFVGLSVDAIWMSRVKLSGYQIHRSAFRHIIGRLIATFLGRGLALFPYDTQCGFKLFKNSHELSNAIQVPFNTKWFVDLELLFNYSNQLGRWMKIREVPLEYWLEVKGSKITIKSYLSILEETLRIRRKVKRLGHFSNGLA